ncbi:MAG: sulfatase [Gemmatimonadales bacterium]|jgi:arylsulfatase A-like enzyme
MNRPNIVLIVLDSVRQDHLSCYGYGRPTTPNIDRIAEDGIRYTRASAASCWTLPSHASLFTGLYPSQHRADLDAQQLESRHETIASRLKSVGYRAGSISCNSFITEHLAAGFEVNVDVEALRGASRPLGRRLLRGVHRRWRGLTRRDRGARRATQLALRLMSEWAGEPFFLFLNYMDCHLPYRLRSRERYEFVASEDRRRVSAAPQDPFATMAGRVKLSESNIQDLEALYDGCLYYLDKQVGHLDRRLRDLGLSDRTLLVVTSDHGESFGEHGLMDHQFGLYEHLLSVPLVMRVPGRKGSTSDDRITQHIDLVPTILDVVGNAPGPSGSERSHSLLGGAGRDAAFAEYLVPNLRQFHRRFPEVDVSRFDRSMRSIRTERFKLIAHQDGKAQLYDLTVDPGERVDLSGDRPRLVAQLQDRLGQTLGHWPDRGAAASRQEGQDELRERLEQLGYL